MFWCSTICVPGHQARIYLENGPAPPPNGHSGMHAKTLQSRLHFSPRRNNKVVDRQIKLAGELGSARLLKIIWDPSKYPQLDQILILVFSQRVHWASNKHMNNKKSIRCDQQDLVRTFATAPHFPTMTLWIPTVCLVFWCVIQKR